MEVYPTTTGEYNYNFPIENRMALSRLLAAIWLEIDHMVLRHARITSPYIDISEYPTPTELSMHRALGDAAQYLGLMTEGRNTITAAGINGYSLQEIVVVIRELVFRSTYSENEDVEMGDMSVPEHVRNIRNGLLAVLIELEAGNEQVEPIARLDLNTGVFEFWNKPNYAHSHVGSERTKVSPALASSTCLTTADKALGLNATHASHLSPKARSHVRNWVQSTAKSNKNIPSHSSGPILNSDSYTVAPSSVARHGPTTELKPILSSESFTATPSSIRRGYGPTEVDTYCGSLIFAVSSPLSNENESIAPSESASQLRHRYPGAPRLLHDGSISPTFSNCSVAPSESISHYGENTFQFHNTWAAHPYHNAPKEGEIVGGARFLRK